MLVSARRKRMKRIFKTLFGLLGAVVLLLLLAAFLIPLIFDKEDLKSVIAAKFQQQTGRELTIDGELDFTVFPWVAIIVSDMSISNAESFGDEDFASIRQARVGVGLIPLFSKKIVVDEITLDELQLALAVNERGQNNWDDLSEAGGESTDESAGNGESAFSSQEVAGLNIRNAQISYKDLESNLSYLLSEFSMQTGALGTDEPLPLVVSMLLEDLFAKSSYEVGLSAAAAINLDTEQYRFKGLELEMHDVTTEGESSPVRIQTPLLQADLAAQTLVMESFTVSVAELEISGALSAEQILGDPEFTGALSSNEFSPAELMSSMAIETPPTTDPNLLQRSRFSADLTGNLSEVRLDNLSLELDESAVAGNILVRNSSPAFIRFDFDIDELNVDGYLAPASETADEDVAIPKEEIQGIDLQGNLKVGQMQLAGLAFTDAGVGVKVVNGALRLHPVTAEFYGGTYSGDIYLNSSGATPVVELDEKLDSVTFQQLVGDLVDTESLSGMAIGHVKLKGQGKTSSEMLGSLNGDMGLTLTEGALEGINIWYEIRRAYAVFKGLPPPDPEPDRTVFSKMQMSASVNDGVMNTRDLVGELPFLTIRGNGAINLAQSQVDLGLVAAIRDVPELNDDPLAADLGGKQFPLKISGPLDDPGITVDWEELLKGEAVNMLLDKLIKSDSDDDSETKEEDPDAEDTQEESSEEKVVKGLFNILKSSNKDSDNSEQEP
jgi:AsmA protein